MDFAERDGASVIPDRLYELLVDLADEGARTLGEVRFYALRSFLPADAKREDVVRRLGQWLGEARRRGWVDAEAGWESVQPWLQDAERDPWDEDLGPGPALSATAVWQEEVTAARVAPQGTTAWTWPEGWDRTW